METKVNKRDYAQQFEKRKQTSKRHAAMKCSTFDIKLCKKMSRAKKDVLNQLFKEAKWFENYCINDVKAADYKVKAVDVKVCDVFENRDLVIFSSQMKQSALSRLKSNIKTLSIIKKQGGKVGSIKFKTACNSILLMQFGVTYRVDFSSKRLSLQNVDKTFKLLGLNQIPEDAEITSANLVRSPDGFHLFVTCFYDPESPSKADKKIGIDLGIKDSVVTSDGKRYDIMVEESKGVKLTSRKMNRSLHKAKKLGVKEPKKGKNHFKRKKKLQRAYQKVKNKRQDLANKVVHEILTENSFVAMQDELIKLWHKGWFGKQVQRSALGEVKTRLKQSSKVVVIESDFPSTQICPHCGQRTKHSLEKRKYICEYCGYSDDRDINAAKNLLQEALLRENDNQVSSERRANSLAELKTSSEGDTIVS